MTRILTFGAFDLLHYGHLRLLARVRAMGEHLIVGLATDDIIMAGGKPKPYYSHAIRREMLLHTRHVDAVLTLDGPIDGTGRVKIIRQKIDMVRRHQITLVAMGQDWEGEYEFLTPWCDVVYIERTPGISSTTLRNTLGGGYAPLDTGPGADGDRWRDRAAGRETSESG
ncbi:glycerol-3-phosphate cytidylyltransferase [Methyloparacoccus murrellii]